jgi:hypothetical protein
MRISKGSDMTLLIAFIMWILVNALDIVTSMVAINWGAGEIGFLQGVGSFPALVVVKMVLVVIVGVTLLRKKKENLLVAFSLGLSAICIYNGCVIIKALEIIQAATGL